MRLTIKMKDGSILKEVDIYRSKEMGNSVTNIIELETLLQSKESLHFGNRYIQGWLIPQQIERYEYVTIYE